MDQMLTFWPKSGLFAYVAGSPAGKNEFIYTKPKRTVGFTEVVAQLEIDAPIIDTALAGSGSITVYTQISDDLVNWELEGTDFTPVTQAGSIYPVKEIIKITTIATFMRFRIQLTDAGANSNIGGVLHITGIGRSGAR